MYPKKRKLNKYDHVYEEAKQDARRNLLRELDKVDLEEAIREQYLLEAERKIEELKRKGEEFERQLRRDFGDREVREQVVSDGERD